MHRASDVIVAAVPFGVSEAVLVPLAPLLRNKVLIDCTNPLNPDWSPVLLGQENSAAEVLAKALPDTYVVKAFNTIFADVMAAEYLSRGGLRARLTFQLCGLARYLEAMAHLNIQLAVGQKGGTSAALNYHQFGA
jgi:8-hydroxy-5-deazaflavin:NADPH oxidoreductase